MLATSFDEAESGTDDRAENGENLLEMALDGPNPEEGGVLLRW